MRSIYLSIVCQLHLPAEIVILRHYVFDSHQKYFSDHELYQFIDAVIRSQNHNVIVIDYPNMIIVRPDIAFSRRRVQNLRKTIVVTLRVTV
jgi:hypothetical protein